MQKQQTKNMLSKITVKTFKYSILIHFKAVTV